MFYKKLFQIFEYLIVLPPDFNKDSWLIAAKPEGVRVLLISQN